ncbi:MAG: hypothetical protein K8F91_13150 [Candidatus Obscuribacterales bacterium]|nr:hypothetical protein [Candidatus Obscuribacterales bacterium]
MILEAFSAYLHNCDPGIHARVALCHWLWEKLSLPPTCQVDQVIHCEISMSIEDTTKPTPEKDESFRLAAQEVFKLASLTELDYTLSSSFASGPERNYVFRGTSNSGERLLKSLDEFSKSYEHQKWARWVHKVKASDFKDKDA